MFCTILPIQKNQLEQWEFAIHEPGDDPALAVGAPGDATSRQFFGRGKTTERAGGLRLNPAVDRAGTRPMLAGITTAAETIWRPESLLNSLEHDQNEQNILGRRRLRDGVLTASAGTVVITGDADLDPTAFDFIYQPAFLTPAECALLTETAAALAGQQQSDGVTDEFWKGRFLQVGDVLLRRPGARP